jgi:predicted amidohydrolase YtcJ
VKIFSDGALGSHTCHTSRSFAGEEDRKGVLAPGKLADVIAVDTDPYRESPADVEHASPGSTPGQRRTGPATGAPAHTQGVDR